LYPLHTITTSFSKINFNLRLGIFLFATVSRPALGPTQPPIQWVPRALFLRVKRPGREADHSPSSNAEVKNTPSRRGAQLKHRDNFTFTLSLPLKWSLSDFCSGSTSFKSRSEPRLSSQIFVVNPEMIPWNLTLLVPSSSFPVHVT
jgi:hypothetical protein